MHTDFQNKLKQDIQQYGCQVLHIAEEDELPPFAYSIGIHQTSAAPEVVVIGLKQAMAHSVVNEYNTRVRAGERFVIGQRYSGFLGGHDVQIGSVHHSHYDEYFGTAMGYYDHADFEVLQIIWPNTSGVWPWDEAADDWLQQRQPLLAEPAP